MELRIADNIRGLRMKMGVTQETFAKDICVTAQAVSKWERGEGYPDITLLPDIAAYFHVSLDALCGIDEQQKQEQISSIIRETSRAPYEEGVRIAREGLAKFPYSARLKSNLAEALMGCTARWTQPREVLEEVIGLYEDIIRQYPDLNEVSPNAYPLLCRAYVSTGNQKKAKQIALRINGKYESQRMWCEILTGEELVSHVQNSIIQTVPDIHFLVKNLLNTTSYTRNEKIALCQKMIEIYALLDECHEWPIGMLFSYQLYIQIAVLSLDQNDTRACLDAIEKAVQMAVRTDSLPSEGPPSSMLLNRIDFSYLSGYKSEQVVLREQIEAEPAFDSIRNMSEYQRIIKKLQ